MSNTYRSKTYRKDKQESKINKINTKVTKKSYSRQKEKQIKQS